MFCKCRQNVVFFYFCGNVKLGTFHRETIMHQLEEVLGLGVIWFIVLLLVMPSFMRAIYCWLLTTATIVALYDPSITMGLLALTLALCFFHLSIIVITTGGYKKRTDGFITTPPPLRL